MPFIYQQKQRAGSSIQRIRIEKLFGRYTYDLRPKAAAPNASRLLILYGDNGSGKTTILNLIFNLISHVVRRGHKTYLARTRFKKLILYLDQGVQVGAVRGEKSVKGSFTAFIKRKGKMVSRIRFTVDKVMAVRPHERYDRFHKSLEELNIGLFFLTDDRQLLSNVPRPSEDTLLGQLASQNAQLERYRRKGRPSRSQYLDAAVLEAISNAVESIKGKVLFGSKQGEADANTIYADIVSRLASTTSGMPETKRTSLNMLMKTLNEQEVRSREFAKFGFPAAVNINDLIKSLSRVRREMPTIIKIVQPFVDTTKAKLDALQEVQDSVSRFVSTLNSFFRDKTVSFDLNLGITITTADRTILPPADLSSGEKQLLLMFCNILSAKNEETICLIDEPEMSLNIKWQRRLIFSLLESTQNRSVQFVFATHSFELLAAYRANVVELVDPKHVIAQNTPETHSARTTRNSRA